MLAAARRNIQLIALLAIIVVAVYLGCGLVRHRDAAADFPPAGYAGKLRFLALGDSYTIGESVPAADRWPMRLADRLRHAGVDLSDPQIIARTGWTTADLLEAMDETKPVGNFDLVTVMIGVNNQYQGRSADEYRQQFVEVLKRAIALAGGKSARVVVLSIPDWGVTPFARQRDAGQIATAIDDFNRINLEETKKAGARYVDVTPSSRRAATQPNWIADDGLHPTRPQYGNWTDAVMPAARAALGQ